jgi:regulator of protease activity HflC (stomatin/prohibitin superfamily)
MQKGFEGRHKPKKPVPIKLIVISSIVGIMFIVGGIFAYRSLGYYYVQADEVAVVVNNLTGGVKAIDRAGAIIYIPLLQDVYALDKKEQVFLLSTENITPAQPEGNPLWVKSKDGGDVSLDLLIRYVMDPNRADFIIQTSGMGSAYKDKWLYDYARAICRYNFGELMLEEFPDAPKRDQKARQAEKELNKLLNPWSIKVTAINALDYRYYREYAEKVMDRRLSDKEVEVQLDRQKAARENQRKVIVEESRKMDVEVARFRGDLQKREINAEAKAEQTRREAEAYYRRVVIEGDAEYERLRQDAQAILAEKKSDAEGILALRRALEQEGGRQLVKMEYARRLREARISGIPVTRPGEEFPQLRSQFERIPETPITK